MHMRPLAKFGAVSVLLFLLAFSGLAFGPCVEKRSLENTLSGFKVTVTSIQGAQGGDGTAAAPYDFPDEDLVLTYNAYALDPHGMLFDFNGQSSLQITPGELSTPTLASFTAGSASGTVSVRKTFGPVTLLVEDIRWVNGDKPESGPLAYQLIRPEGSFASGASNVIHFKYPSLRNIQWDPLLETQGDIDGSSLPGRFVEINCRADASGPLPDVNGEKHGQIIVTGIFGEGFFVTDLSDSGRDYNHLYVYSFNYPEDLEEGDRIDMLMGTTQDFSGCTQISFPAWKRAESETKDPLPYRVPPAELDTVLPPALLTPAICSLGSSQTTGHLCGHSKKNWTMEKLESARVRIESVKIPDVFVNCDYNSDTEIPLIAASTGPGDETTCRDACLKRDGQTNILAKEIIAKDLRSLVDKTCTRESDCDANERCSEDGICLEPCPWDPPGVEPGCMKIKVSSGQVCSELSTLQQYGQWTAALGNGAGPLINIMTRDTIPDFDPTTQENLGKTIEYLQGNLRQVRAARPRWIVLVGFLATDAPCWINPLSTSCLNMLREERP
jgi:hypothetical protein